MTEQNTWEADVAAANAHQAQQPPPEERETPTPGATLVPASRARVPEPVTLRAANRTPVGDELRRRSELEPAKVAARLWDALDAVKVTWQDGAAHEQPDHVVRLRAVETILNRTEGLPVARTEHTGAAGGPITLAALLADDPAKYVQ